MTRASGLAIVAVVVLAMLLLGSVAAGADPTAGASLDPEAVSADLLEGGDPRSEGEGPGLSGAPLLILLAVVGLGLATALVTVLLARLSRRT